LDAGKVTLGLLKLRCRKAMTGTHHHKICYGCGLFNLNEEPMKPFLAACAVAIVLAIIGSYALESVQQTAEHAFNETGAKL
jgi:hypothetical protein